MNVLAVKPSTVAAVGQPPTAASSAVTTSAVEKNKQWQRELLMERIRSHSTQQKTFPELSKSMRMSMLEKRYALDAVEKTNLQKTLDSMQHCIKVTSRQGLVERLESLSRQLGLKFMEDTTGLFISTDMFFLEIMLDANGSLTDVKVHHECKIEQQSCSELVSCLNRGDFADFTVQLEGLSSIYQLNAEPKVKKKAFVALQAMETDLYNLFQVQNFTKDTQQLLESSAVGLVLKRRGGHPMKLTYFVAPYDLICLTDKCLQKLSLDLITSKDVGMSVTVNLEAASANKLQILPTVTFVKDAGTGIETPEYALLTQLNSTLLPATFVLRLNKPLPVCSATLRALLPNAAATAANSDIASTTTTTSTSVLEQKSSPSASVRESSTTIMNLIVQTASEQQLKNSAKGLFVCLPDQTHCYFFTDNKQLKATLVSSVPFTEPSQVPIILAFLKKQALFYSLLSSCVRPQAKMGNDMDTTTILEANAISFQQISVSLQHPYEESMATVEFNLNDSDVCCNIYASTRNYDLLSIKLTKIVQKSLSIPVTIRSLLKFWEQERMKLYLRSIGGSASAANTGSGGNVGSSSGAGTGLTQANNAYGNFSLAMGPNDPGGGGGGGSGGGGNNAGAVTKQESGAAAPQRASYLTSTGNTSNVASATGIAGYLKLKTDLTKPEDFHESPKSATQTLTLNQMQSAEASSLGQTINPQQQNQQTADITTTLATDLEIADKYKNIWKDKTTTLKNTVSITPIIHNSGVLSSSLDSSNSSAVLNSSNLEIKRTGIEIIPLITQNNVVASNSSSNSIVNTSTTAGSATITITPINSGAHTVSKSDKKSISSTLTASSSSSSSSSKRNIGDSSVNSASSDQKEKKRSKKKRDDSPMGPPEKVFSRQNSPATITNAGVDAVTRKFSSPSSSPKGGSSGGGILSATAVGSSASSISARPSPKHSPVYTSPKHHSTASNSPKSPFGTHSPKHGSSGKPSMSTLKSAAASLSPKADKSSSNLLPVGAGSAVANASTSLTSPLVRSLAGVGGVSSASVNSAFVVAPTVTGTSSKNRDKDKNIASAGNLGKTQNTAAVNLPLMKSPSGMNHLTIAGSGLGAAFNAIGGGGSSSVASLDAAMRKGAVSAAVSLMTSTTVSAATAAAAAVTRPQHGNTDNNNTLTSNEYRVKQSQEGLKLTINKTSNKFNSFNSCALSSSSATNSTNRGKTYSSNTSSAVAAFLNAAQSPTKKPHTGLKPGVNSGPASSKKTSSSPATSPAHSASITTASVAKTTTASNQQNIKSVFQKSYSSGNLSTKLTNNVGSTTVRVSSSSNSSDSYRRSSKKSLDRDRERANASTSSSQPATRLDHHADMLKILQYASPAMAANMEGFMKNLSTKFQIPKLSQRGAVATLPSAITKAASAPTTPTLVPTATTFFNPPAAAANIKTTKQSVVPQSIQQQALNDTSNNILTTNLQQQLQSTSLSDQQLLITPTTVRPPPPPYHAAIAAGATTVAVTNSTINMRLTSSSPTSTSSSSSSSTLRTAKFELELNLAADDALLVAANTNAFDK